MKRFVFALSVAMLGAIFTVPQLQAQGPQIRGQAPARPNPNQPLRPREGDNPPNRPGPAPIEDLVQTFFVNQLQQQVTLSDEQFVEILPMAREYLQGRRELSNRKTRAQNTLRQMVTSNAPDNELRRAMAEMDRAENGLLATHQRLLAGADPILSVQQQARLRVFLEAVPNQITRLIQGVRRGQANPPPPPL